jgi:uncharacterized protein (UPF0218 family)
VLELTDELRKILKKPLGKLFEEFEDAVEEIKSANFLISVGDETTINLFKNDLIPNLAIIDNHIQRKSHSVDLNYTKNILNVHNPPGTITDELWETIGLAIEKATIDANKSSKNNANKGNHDKNTDNSKYLIVVNGEEDLAVLPAILMAPDNGIILYGQPNEGLVLLKAVDLKETAEKYIKMFIKT